MKLNEAILVVISNRYKKNAAAAHKIVEAAGYIIDKNHNHYTIRNPKTGRYVYMDLLVSRFCLNWGSLGFGSKEYRFLNDIKFDFVNMLNTPYNHDGNPYSYTNTFEKSKAKERYAQLRRYKRNVTRQQDAVDLLLQQIADLQHKLVGEVEVKVKCETDLNEYRAKCGLPLDRNMG